jgi:hypothetical protein
MTALRITQPTISCHTRGNPRAMVLLVVIGIFGCGTASPPSDDPSPTATSSPGANDPSWLSSRENLPAPDTDRIAYDAKTRVLSFTDLPGNDRWMVQLPDEPNGRPVVAQHRLPDGVDTNRTLVYYARPGSKVSAAVTVAQIAAGRAPHSSQALRD